MAEEVFASIHFYAKFTAHQNEKTRNATKIQKDVCHWIQLIEMSKTSTISWDFVGFAHGRVAKALCINS